MKILLVNPPMTHMVGTGISSFVGKLAKENPLPPLGLMYIASYAEKYGHRIRILDMASGDSRRAYAELRYYMEFFTPNLVGVTATSMTLYDAKNVAWYCKNNWPSITTIIGGPHCNIYPQETASISCIDYLIRGDGWLPFIKLLNGQQTSKISEVEPIDNFDDVPFPARHLIDIDKYHPVMAQKKLITTMITSMGCPYNCVFCYQPHFGRKWRARSAESVLAEMKEIIKMRVHEINVVDETFTYDRERVLKICDLILRREVHIEWDIMTRVDRVDLEMLKLLARAGCKRITYGIESANPSVLRTLRKGFTVEQIEDAIRWTKEAGMEMKAYFMLGSPNETREEMLATINFAKKHIPDYCYYSVTMPLPGASLYEQGLREGRYNDYWREFSANPTPDMIARIWDEDNIGELSKMMKYGYESFYRRPSYVLRRLMKIRTMTDLTNKSKIALAMLARGWR